MAKKEMRAVERARVSVLALLEVLEKRERDPDEAAEVKKLADAVRAAG